MNFTHAKTLALIIAALTAVTLTSPAIAADGTLPEMKWKGDLRLRHEIVHQAGGSPSSYQQQRIQFRLGATTKLNPANEMEFRVATGTGRTSTNQTLGDSSNGFKNYSLTLDRAYFYNHSIEGLDLWAGRIKNTHYMAGGSDLIWDSDINLDGMAAKYQVTIGSLTLFTHEGFYWVSKTTTSGVKDNQLLSAQLGAKHKFDGGEWGLGASYYHYTNFLGQTILDSSNKGNSSSTAGTTTSYTRDYRLINGGLELTLKELAPLPLDFVLDYVRNTAISSQNSGYLAGARIGRTSSTGDWSVGYDYRRLQKDAAVGAFSDGDTLVSGGTNGYSHRIKTAYVITDPVLLAVNVYLGKAGIAPGDTEKTRNKYHFDVTYRF